MKIAPIVSKKYDILKTDDMYKELSTIRYAILVNG